ncbi:PfkB family carbohydrate kinase [Pirellulales bacterium]|nr:PfkB family carbohydrate kinase [Pirellulales bacterium]
MAKSLDCVVVGSCVVDVLVRPVDLDSPIGGGRLVHTEPLELATGGIVSNSGVSMARLGMKVAACSLVGDDPWADVIRGRYHAEGVDASRLIARPDGATSTTAVLIAPDGERSFLHAVGAPKQIDRNFFFSQLDFFEKSRAILLGYYPLLPNLIDDLPEVMAALRMRDCLTAIDAAGDGGDLAPLAPVLPHLDVYFPSHGEAENQTGEHDPEKILSVYRNEGAQGLLGVKLGADGALMSPQPGELVEIAAVQAPGEVLDTTGAGDCFLGGLLTGLLRGLPPADAGRLAAATGACCVTALGASAGVRGYEETSQLARL